jgi:hypothetical protein
MLVQYFHPSVIFFLFSRIVKKTLKMFLSPCSLVMSGGRWLNKRRRICYDYRLIDIMGLNFLTINFQIQRTFSGKNCLFFANFGGHKTNFVCEKTISMLSFFSQQLPDSASRGVADLLSWGVVDSPSRFLITIIDKWKFKGDNFTAF